MCEMTQRTSAGRAVQIAPAHLNSHGTSLAPKHCSIAYTSHMPLTGSKQAVS
jgi:hypothetical protein